MQSRNRLQVEELENRWCPALTTSLTNGVLTVSGTADNGTINISQDSTTVGTIVVSDGDTTVSGSPFADVTSIRLNLTSADDQVVIDLGGQALTGNIVANLGSGANSFTVQNGTIDGTLAVVGESPNRRGHGPHGRGADTTTADTGLDTILLAKDATAGNVQIRGGAGGSDVAVAGAVTGNVVIDASARSSSAGATVDVSGEVDGNVLFFGSDQADSLTISGDVGRSVAAALFAGADSVTIDGTVTGDLLLSSGAGDDALNLNNVVGGRAFIAGEAGNDALTVGAGADLKSNAVFSMGAGADTVTLDDAAIITDLLVNGGTGTDTFIGAATRAGLRLISF